MNPHEVTERSYEAFNNRDLDTLRELYTPDCVWSGEGIEGWPGATRYVGHEGLAEFIDEWWGAWEKMTTTPREIVPGPNGTFVLAHVEGRARGGMPLQWELGQVVRLAPDGRIASVEHFNDVDEARRVAGL